MRSFWRKLKERRLPLLVVGIVLAFTSVFLQYIGFTNHSVSYQPKNFYTANIDDKGNKYIVSDGRKELAKISSDNTVLWIKNAAKVKEFKECGSVVVDLDGNIYVHDMRFSSEGLSLDGEFVLKYSSAGNYLGEIFSVTYNKSSVYKPQLFGLSVQGDKVSFVHKQNKNYSVYSAEKGKNAVLQKSGVFEHEIQDIAIYNENISYTTKNGEVYTQNGAKDAELIFKPEKKSFVVPFKIVYSSVGNIYFTDIGNNNIYTANEKVVQLLLTSSEVEKEFDVSLKNDVLKNIAISGNNNLLFPFDNVLGIINLENKNFQLESAYSFKFIYFVLLLTKQIAIVLGAIFVLFGGILYAKDIFKWFIKSKSRTTILLIGSIAVTMAIIMPSVLSQVRNTLVDAKKDELTRIAASVAFSLKAEDLQALNYPEDYDSESGQNVRKMISQMLPQVGSASEIYCNLTKINNDKAYAFFYQDDSIGVFYPLSYEEEQALQNLYATKKPQLIESLNVSTGSYISVNVPIISDNTVIGVVEVGMVLSNINKQLDDILQNVLINIALIVLVLIFLIQAIMSFYTDNKELKISRKKNERPFPVDWLRLCVLICSFAYNMPTAFLPVFMENLYDSSLPFSQYAAGAFPLTINIFLTGVAALICSKVAGKFGIKNSLFFGIICVFLGDLATATAGSYWQAFIGVIFNGIGAGFVLAMLFVIIAKAKPEEQGRGFAAYNGAFMCGVICGTLTGAWLAGSLSQKNVFFCALLMWALLFAVVMLFGKNFVGTGNSEIVSNQKLKNSSTTSFLFSPKVVLFTILVQFPFAASDGFTYYFVPVFGAQQGLTEQQISLLMVLNSLATVFIGEWLTEYFNKKYKHNAMYLAAAILSLAIILFAISPSIATLAIAILVIGIARSFGQPTQDTFICSLSETKRYGTQRGLGVYNFLQNVGDSAGTSIFGFITELVYSSGVSMLTGFGAFAAISAGMAGLHKIAFLKFNKKQKK